MTIDPTGLRIGDPDVYMLHNAGAGGPVISTDPGALATGDGVGHGGHQALNLAILAGASCIVLLGYDLKAGPQVGNRLRNNWHTDHDRQTPRGHYDLYRRTFNKVPAIVEKLGIEVWNATPGSALDVFPGAEIESLLPDPQPAGLSA